MDVRSKHFIFGMSEPTDERFRMKLPSGRTLSGLSVLVKGGFVVGHNDADKDPARVSMRWTEDRYRRSEAEPYYERKFRTPPKAGSISTTPRRAFNVASLLHYVGAALIAILPVKPANDLVAGVGEGDLVADVRSAGCPNAPVAPVS